MKKEAANKNRKWLLPVIIAAAVLVIAGVLLAIFLGPWNQGGTQSGGKVNSKLYWNVDRLQFVEEETGFSIRTKGEDGLYSIRFAVDGEHVEFKTADKRLVNSIDMLDLMGLIFDADGLIADLVLPTDVAVETAFEFFVQETTDTTVTINSSMAMTGMSMTIDITENTGIYNVTPKAEFVGQKDTCELMDKVSVYSNEAGEVTHIFITERNPEAGIYIIQEQFYDKLTGETTREPDANGVYTIAFAYEGELVDLKCKDKAVVSLIDSKSIRQMGLLFDEEGYISDVVDVAVGLRGKLVCTRYHVTAIEGDMVTLESIWYYNRDIGNTVTVRMREDCDIFITETACGAEFIGQRVDNLQVNDFVYLYTDLHDEAILAVIQTRMVEGPLYYNIDRSWNGQGTKRTPDENGWYVFRVIGPEGLMEVRTKDKAVADKADKHYCFGLELKGNVILDAYDPKCVTGNSSCGINYYVSDISGPVTRIVNNTDFEKGTNYMSAADCLIFDASDRYSTKIGTKTTLRVGDKVTAYGNPSNELTYVYVTSRYIEGAKIYYNVNRQYDSTLKETKRVANEEGYYVFDMICEGKAVQVKTKDKALANYIEEKICTALLVSNGIIKDAAAPESAIKYGIHALNNYYVNSFKEDGILEVYYGSVDNRTYTDIRYALSNKTKIYNVGDGYLNYQGETTKLQKNDYIYGYASVQTGELEVVFIRGRKMDTKLYWNPSPMYNSTTKETTRVPNAEGYYVFDLLVDGVMKQFKTKDKAIASKVDSYSAGLGLRLDGDIILQAYGPNSIKGISGGIAQYYDVMSINGNKLHMVRNQVNSSQRGKEADIELAKDCKIYDISPSAKTYGEAGTIGLGDRLICFADEDGKVAYVFIQFKSTRKAGSVGMCQHCNKEVWWEPYNAVYAVQDAHYYLTADMTKSERSVGYAKERLEEDPTLQQYEAVIDLNGFTLTSENRRNFSLYSTLSVVDSVGGGKLVGFGGDRAGGNFYMYAGSTLNLYGGELCGSGADMIQSKGGIIFANDATINVYGGKIAGGRAQMGGNIYLANATLNVYGGEIAGDILADTKSTVVLNGKVTIAKGLYEGIKVNPEARIDVSKLDPSSSVVVSAEGVFTTEHDHIAKFQNAFVPLYDRDSIAVEGKALSYVKGEIPAEEVAASIESWIAANAAAFTSGTNLPTDCPCCVGLVSWVAIDGTEGAQVTSTLAGPKTHFYLANDMEINGDYRFLRSSEPACLYLNNKQLTHNGNNTVFHGAAATLNIFGDGNVIKNGTGDASFMFEYNGGGTIKIYGGSYTHNATAVGMFKDLIVTDDNKEGTHAIIYGGTFNVNPAGLTFSNNNVVTLGEGLAANNNGDGTWTVGEPIPDVSLCAHCNQTVEWEIYTGTHKTEETALTAAAGHKHYKLAGDMSYRTSNGVYGLYITNGSACFDLAGYDISRGSGGEAAFYNQAGTLNIIDSGRKVGGETKVGSAISSAGGAVETGSGSAVVNIYGGKFHKFSGYAGTAVIDINAGGTVNLYDGIVTTDGVTNNSEGPCVWMVGDADNKAVFNMYGGTVTVGTATCSQAADEPGGAICVGRLKLGENHAEANILGGTVIGGDLADAAGDSIYVANGCTLTIGGTAVINGEVATGGENASVILSGTPKIVALEGGNGLFLNGALANIDALEAGAQIQVTPKAGDVLTAASENAAAVESCFTATNGREIDVVANQLVVSSEQPDIPLVPGQLPTTCPGCGMDIGESSWTAITELTAPAASDHNSFIYAGTSYAKAHCYLANDITLTDAGYSVLNAFGGTTCLYLNGKTLTYSGSSPVFRTVGNTLNIYGEGAVINNADKYMFDFNGTGRVNILGGTYVQNSTTVGMFEDLVVTEGQTTHALLSGGTFNVNPAALSFNNANVLTIAEGFMSSDNGDGTWSIVEGEPEEPSEPTEPSEPSEPTDPSDPTDPESGLPTTCPGCGAAVTEWSAITEDIGDIIYSDSSNYGTHLYLANDVTIADTRTNEVLRAYTANGCCLYLNGKTLTYNGSGSVFHARAYVMNICGDGNVINNGTGTLFTYNGAGRINIYGGTYTQNGTAGMFKDLVLTEATRETHVMLYGGTFNVDPSALTFENSNVVTIAEGLVANNNGDGTWTVAEPTAPVLPTTCPGCGVAVTEWSAITEDIGNIIYSDSSNYGTHLYLANDVTIADTRTNEVLRAYTANGCCLYLNGKTLTYNGSGSVFHARANMMYIFGEGKVINNGSGNLFTYNGGGTVNILGGEFVQNGTAGMFKDLVLTGTNGTTGEAPTTHALISGGTFNVDPSALTFENSNVVTIAEGYAVTDNGDGTWTVAEGEPSEPTDPSEPTEPEVQLPTTCPGCQAENVEWTAITGEEGKQVYPGDAEFPGTHYYLSKEITIDGTYRFLRAYSGVDCCLYLNGQTLTYTGSNAVFHAGSQTVNICGEGNVINSGSSNMFAYNGAGRINIIGGTYTQSGTAGMFQDKVVTDGQTTHVLISGGKFNVNPAELTFENENVVTIAEGYAVTDNGDGTWTVAEAAPSGPALPTTCPGCQAENVEWHAITGTEGEQVYPGADNFPGNHYYLANEITITGTYRFLRAYNGVDCCLYLNGQTLNYNGSANVFHAGGQTINICGEGTVNSSSASSMFNYNGAGQINIYGGIYNQTGTGAMFEDKVVLDPATTHVMVYGGTFNVDPATLTFDNSNVVTIAEGYAAADNGNSSWTVMDATKVCPGCRKVVEPTAWEEYTGQYNGTTNGLTAEDGHKHYKLTADYLNNASTIYALKITTGTACFDLAGYNVVRDGSATAAFYNEAGTLTIVDTGRDVEGEMVYGTVTGSSDSAVQLGSGAAVVNLKGGTFTKFASFPTTPVINLKAGGTVNLYDGATITTDGKTNNRGGSCVSLAGTATDKAVFNMYGGVVEVGATATNQQNANNPGGAITTGRPVASDAASNAEVNIFGGTVTGANLENSVGDCIYIKNGTSLNISGDAVINGEVTLQGSEAAITLSGAPKILAQEGGNGLVLNGALANIAELEAEAQIQVTGVAGDVLTAESENAANVAASFSVTTDGLAVKDENNQLVIAENLVQAMLMTLKSIFA